MKKTLSVVLALLMVLAAIPAFAAPVEIDYWSVFTGADGANSTPLRMKSTSIIRR